MINRKIALRYLAVVAIIIIIVYSIRSVWIFICFLLIDSFISCMQ